MDIRHLRNFISVAHHLNFSAAARELHIDQSSLSKQISELEERIGLKLFVRSTRNVQLTAAGSQLLNDAKSIISFSEEAINRAKQAAEGITGQLRIGFIETYRRELPPVIKAFRDCRPKATIQLHRLGWGPLNEALENGEIDIAFTFSYRIEDIPYVTWLTSTTHTPLCAVVSKEHPLACRDQVSISDLAHEPFVLLTRQEYPLGFDVVRRLCLSNGFYPNIVNQTPLLENLLLLVETGIGITILSRFVQVGINHNVSFVEIKDSPLNLHWVIAWKKNNLNPLIPVFLEVIKKTGNFQ